MKWLHTFCASCFHANMLSMPTKKACPFLLCFNIWPRSFLSTALKSLRSKCGYSLTQIVTIYHTVHLSSALCSSWLPLHSWSVCHLVTVCYSHSVVTLWLLCLQFSFWMISWGYQTFLKETLSINIFLIWNFTIRGPCLSLCQSEREKRKVMRSRAKIILMRMNCLLVSIISCDKCWFARGAQYSSCTLFLLSNCTTYKERETHH